MTSEEKCCTQADLYAKTKVIMMNQIVQNNKRDYAKFTQEYLPVYTSCEIYINKKANY